VNDPPVWIREQAPTYRGPTVAKVLAAGLVAWLLALSLQSQPTPASSSPARSADTPVCAELARLTRHGYTSGSHYRATRAACVRARAELSR
jgi:hypothetical protein